MLDRYEGKSFLKLIDLFVLDCIGGLDEQQLAGLDQLTPGLRAQFGGTGTWQEIVMAQIGYDASARDKIRDLWISNRRVARHNGGQLEAMEFVHAFVDAKIKQH